MQLFKTVVSRKYSRKLFWKIFLENVWGCESENGVTRAHKLESSKKYSKWWRKSYFIFFISHLSHALFGTSELRKVSELAMLCVSAPRKYESLVMTKVWFSPWKSVRKCTLLLSKTRYIVLLWIFFSQFENSLYLLFKNYRMPCCLGIVSFAYCNTTRKKKRLNGSCISHALFARVF